MLSDYRLTCQLGDVDDDLLIIRNLPLFLANSARARLEHLPEWQIYNRADLVRIFIWQIREFAKSQINMTKMKSGNLQRFGINHLAKKKI